MHFLTGYMHTALLLAFSLNLSRSEWTAKRVLCVTGVFYAPYTVLATVFNITLLIVYVWVLFVILALRLLFKLPWQQSIFLGIFASFFGVVLEYVFLLIIVLLPEVAQTFIFDHLFIPRTIAIAYYALLYIFSERLKNNEPLTLAHFATTHWILYFVLFTFFADFNLARFYDIQPTIYNVPELIVVILFLLFFLYNLIHMENITKMLKFKEKLEYQKLLEQEIELQRRRNYEQLVATHAKFQTYQDSVEEAMSEIWNMGSVVFTKQGRARQIESYQTLLFRIHELKQNFNLAFCTGNETLDVVLSSKDELARKQNIKLKGDLDLLDGYHLDSEVVGGILINVLDSAIETVGVIADMECEKVISISILAQEGCLDISIEYPADSWVKTKEAHNHKDVGLQISKKLTEKIKGEFKAVMEEYYYTINIQVPLYEKYKQKQEPRIWPDKYRMLP